MHVVVVLLAQYAMEDIDQIIAGLYTRVYYYTHCDAHTVLYPLYPLLS